jgi:hypothetical protein
MGQKTSLNKFKLFLTLFKKKKIKRFERFYKLNRNVNHLIYTKNNYIDIVTAPTMVIMSKNKN